MTQFDFAAAIRNRPSGQTTSALVAAFGNPEGPGAGSSPQGGAWFTPSPTWVRANVIKIPLSELPGFPRCPYGALSGVSLHRLVAPVFRATWAELHRRGLTKHLRTFDGSVAYRHMGHDRSRPLSAHAFGIALDFDAAWNGYGVPLEQMQINREVVQVFEECGWTWGGAGQEPTRMGCTSSGRTRWPGCGCRSGKTRRRARWPPLRPLHQALLDG
ncbi:M15 family metallopeptidase [Deinococcus lacus]|uniref:M15 family metallopeptidase n=1 Tax=Deinococcus lacus TaxID=392561 RepID=A0ABW1YE89_9DEIO